MKKGVLFLLSALTFGTLVTTSITSCASSQNDDSVATISIFSKSDVVTYEIENSKETYSAGDKISLKLTFQDGYDLAYVTLNGEKVEDITSITLKSGDNVINIYAKGTNGNEGSTNIRDFVFEATNNGREYSVISYIPSGILPSIVEIPETFNGKPVTSLDYRVNKDGSVISRYNFGGVKGIFIPKTIKNIDGNVFRTNVSVASFKVDEANENFSSDGTNLFNKDKTKLISYAQGSKGEVVIPTTVKTIGEYAFFGANELSKVTLNEGLTKIEKYAFASCKQISEIVIPNSVTQIDEYAFQNCLDLKKVILSESLTRIPSYCFSQCSKIAEITIPASVKTISTYAFFSTGGLKKITFREGLATIGETAFSYTGVEELNFPKSLRSIGKSAFAGCDYLTKVHFEEGIESLGDTVFNVTKQLNEINIPASLTKIGKACFTACLSLKEFVVNENNVNYKSIDGVLFDKEGKTLISYPNSKDAKEYVIPSTTEKLDYHSFNYISNHPLGESSTYYSLENLTIPKSVKIMENPFYGAKLREVIYEGTEEEFLLINSTIIVDNNPVSWNDGSSIAKITYKGSKA